MRSNINILGTNYDIILKKTGEDEKFKTSDGYIDTSTKEIVIEDMMPDANTKSNLDAYKKQIIRHEIIHGFLFESGLDNCSGWAINEEMVDFFAIQFEKIYKACREADALSDIKVLIKEKKYNV